ncbi:MAG TPA: hypothetical protein VHS09_05055, partial [Polyangiaceae bacterium]|nr:hypothetical protein [Polyangiaceae bacterium]
MSRASRARSPAGDLGAALQRLAATARATSYPLTKYAGDPVRYCQERLGVRLMPHQEEILVGLARGIAGGGPDRVAVRSGQKCGKTKIAIVAALWFFECFAGARVFLCAAIIEQTKNVLWRELAQTLREAKAAGAKLEGKLAASPMGGLVSLDGSREIRGISGREIEAIAGLSGRMLTIVDEASHLPENKAQVFAGNTMGGGALLFISNPTRNAGPFFDAFHEQKAHWQTFHVDAEEVASWQARMGVRVPYTATQDKIAEFRAMYGEDSPFWFLRVKGEWLRNETGRCIPMFRIEQAVARHATAPDSGPLTIGYDCAGPGDGGDEHVWAVVRGSKCLTIHRRRGLNEEAALAETSAIVRTARRENEDVRLLVDAEGPIGGALYGRLRAEAEHRRAHDPGNAFTVVPVRASSRFVREPTKFGRVRDELVWRLAEWLIDGSIPVDAKLEAELYAPSWETVASGCLKCTSKSVLRDMLGRSPDSFD